MENEKVPAVTVITPVYNSEKFLEECLQSLVNQTFKNFEVIVVDDCSTDNSLKIAQKFIAEFEKIDVKLLVITISPNSERPGIPRNIAMNYATGKYIYFLDSDDFLDETVLEDFYKVAENFNADVVHAEKCFKTEKIDGKFTDQIHFMESTAATEKPTLETFDITKRVENFLGFTCTPIIWSKFFRRDFLIENNIKFPEITVSEDFVFTFQCICLAKNYVRMSFIGYHYRKHDNSTTKTPSTVELSSFDLIEGVHFLDNFMKKQKFFIDNPKYQYPVLEFFVPIFSNLIFKHIFFNLNLSPEEIYDFYRNRIFVMNPQKNIPLTSYLFVSMNICKMLVNQQSLEIERLQKLLQEK